MQKKRLFLSGTARAGTSALVNILNLHNHILMGQERYFFKFQKDLIVPGHFAKNRFLSMREGDTHEHGRLMGRQAGLERFGDRFDHAVYVGDKFPPLFRHLDYITATFPRARHIYILRNPLSVVESYEARFRDPEDNWNLDWRAGLAAWNQSVSVVAALPEEALRNFIFVQYEEIYAETRAINALFTRLGLSNLEPETLEPYVAKFGKWNEELIPRRDDIRLGVARGADWAAYGKLCTAMEGSEGAT